jgi:hypothetical protein
MFRLAATLAIFAALISVCSADQAYLGEKEVSDLIAGNTVHGQGLQSGTQFQSFYDLNGRWRLEQSGSVIERDVADQVRRYSLCREHGRGVLLCDPKERRWHLRLT